MDLTHRRLRRLLVALPILGASFLLPLTPASADTVVGTCTNAAFVDGANSFKNTNYGNDVALKASPNRPQYTYVECVVSGIPAGATGISGTLDLRARSDSPVNTARTHSVATGWTETTLVYTNRPTFDINTILGSVSVTPNTDARIPVTGVTGNGTYRYAVTSPGANGVLFHSDETATPPKLTITYTGTPPPPVAPSATTGAATSITETTATLGGSVNPNGSSTTAKFDWGTTTSYGNSTPDQSIGSGTTSVSVSAPLTGLTASTTYHFRISATSTGGTTVGTDATFTTAATPPPPVAPSATTDPATSITATSATANGTVNANGSSTVVTFEYGTTISYGSAVTAAQSPVSGSTATAVSAPLSGLTASTAYHYRVKAVNAGGTTYGADATFTTSAAASCVADVTLGPVVPGTLASTMTQARDQNRLNKSVCVLLQSGVTYREIMGLYADGSQTAKSITVEGNGATINGADVLPTWTSIGGGKYTAPWTINLGNLADPWPTLSYNRVLLNREALFVADVPYYVTDDPAVPVVGTFYVDETNNLITVNARAEHTPVTSAEVTARRKIVEVANRSLSPITIRNLTVTRGAAAVQENMLDVTNSANLTLENITATQSAGGAMGLCCGTNYTLRNITNSQNGITATGGYQVTGLSYTDVHVTLTNWRGAQAGFYGWATGSKILSSQNVTILRWTADKNMSHGFWLDASNRNVTVTDLISAGNTGRGVFNEKNPGPVTFENATVCNNGYSGFSHARSDNTTIRNSRVFGNAGFQHMQTGDANPVTLPDGTIVYGHNMTIENSIAQSADDWPVAESLNQNWLFWNTREDAFWTTAHFTGNTWWHALRAASFRIPSGGGNVAADYPTFAAKIGETGGQYANPGTLTCSAPRPPATIDFAVGW